MNEENTLDNINSYLTFLLDEELFSVNVGKVIEILEVPKLTKVPQAPSYMAGVMNLRGNVLPVIDTKIKFGLGETDIQQKTCIVVMDISIEGESVYVGALVDSVLDVLELSGDKLLPPPTVGIKYRPEFITGIGKDGDDFIMILNIDKVFSTDELSILKDSSQTL
ncbi:MAG: purine-binding chemotaxis protein CheW [Cytophagales bacterium]|nr:purine-binding chemotaxis protein CheW [Cytophagales bacterium]